MEYSEKFLLVNGEEIEIVINDNDLDQLDLYGRFFVWPDLLPKNKHQDMIEAVKLWNGRKMIFLILQKSISNSIL